MNHTKTFLLLAALTAIFMGAGYLIGGLPGMLVALVVAAGLNLFSYWNADRIVLRMYGAQVVDETHADPRVRIYVADVKQMARDAGLPQPAIAIIPTDQPNAFATGRDPANAAVCATIGLLTLLTREEVRAVMAHELAHVKNRDTLTMTVTATVAGAIAMLANFAMFFGGRDRPGGVIGSIAIMIFAPMAAALVQMAISRSREYEADRVGAAIAGDAHSLASALQKIDATARHTMNPQAERNPASGQLFIINPLSGAGADNLFSTHPSTANRVRALGIVADDLGHDRLRAEPQHTFEGPWSRKPHEPGPWG
jgi:heat shock protein HtpX